MRTLPLRGLAASLIALALAMGSPAAPAQSVAEGQWINLFDGESLFGWTAFGDPQWAVADGVLTCAKGSGGWLASTCRFGDFEMTAEVRLTGPGTMGIVVRGALEGHPTENGSGMILLSEEGKGDWREITVKAQGGQVTATIDGAAVEGLSAKNPLGHVGLLYHRYHKERKAAKVEVKSVKLRPLALTPLLNGKDLEGWNIIPGHQSKFNIVDGAINITDGNGQIETAQTYRDFIVQMDIISNGEHLNSGVFFRGPVGVFWKGYESQVRNQWANDDRTKPVDFGTGGIYGVQETRKVVPNDGDWFNKTIVCDGNHMAVWINGYLVSDLYDMRPVSPEGDGKNGYVPQPGTIHLQGHDPTTDLSFKNINIQVYPAE